MDLFFGVGSEANHSENSDELKTNWPLYDVFFKHLRARRRLVEECMSIPKLYFLKL